MAQSDPDIGSLNSGTDKDDAFSGEQGSAAAMRQRRQAALAHRGRVRGGKRDGAGRRKGTVKKCLLKGLGRHTSEDTCPIRRGGKRPWGDRKNGNPKGLVCRVCCSAHKKLHPGLSLPELIKHMEEVPQARIEFDEGCQSYIDQQKERLVAVDLDRPQFREQDNLDGDADVEAANMAAREAREAAEERALAPADAAAAQHAVHVRYSNNSGKRRGQLVLNNVFVKENPNVKIAAADIERRKSKDKRRYLEYVKVYRDKEDERIDFSEDEGNRIDHVTGIDAGDMILREGQAAQLDLCVLLSHASRLLD